MKVDVVLISGKMGSGKDETFRQLKNFIMSKDPTWEVLQMSFARPIRTISEDVRSFLEDFGVTPPPGFEIKDGELMQLIGAWGRKRHGKDVWLNILKKQMEEIANGRVALNSDRCRRLTFVITDCRFENEFDAFPDALRIRLECDREIRRMRCENWRDNETHESEIDLDDYAVAELFDEKINTGVVPAITIAENIFTDLIHETWKAER